MRTGFLASVTGFISRYESNKRGVARFLMRVLYCAPSGGSIADYVGNGLEGGGRRLLTLLHRRKIICMQLIVRNSVCNSAKNTEVLLVNFAIFVVSRVSSVRCDLAPKVPLRAPVEYTKKRPQSSKAQKFDCIPFASSCSYHSLSSHRRFWYYIVFHDFRFYSDSGIKSLKMRSETLSFLAERLCAHKEKSAVVQ